MKKLMHYDGDEFEQPQDVIPGYETDMRAVGVNRVVADDALDEVPWYEYFPDEHVVTVELPEDAQVRP